MFCSSKSTFQFLYHLWVNLVLLNLIWYSTKKQSVLHPISDTSWKISNCIQGHLTISSVQSLRSCPTLCDPMNRSTPGLPVESVMPSSHLILCHPLLLPPSVFPSIGVFSSETALRIRWPKHWSFSFGISASNDYSGLISLRTDEVSRGLYKTRACSQESVMRNKGDTVFISSSCVLAKTVISWRQ